MDSCMRSVLERFQLDAPAVSCERYGCGHINETYLVKTDGGSPYILQKINRRVFRDIPGLMENIRLVTQWLARQEKDARRVLTLVPTRTGEAFCRTEDGSYWRVYVFVEDALCLQRAESAEDLRQSAIAFGNFQQLLKDFPAGSLRETIPNFHNTPDRYRTFRETLARDPMGRAARVQKEIEFVLARESLADALTSLLAEGKLPLRVTHNDTKLNNVMLDAKSRQALCVIDLDTVMPGLSLYDYGDSIRFGAAGAAEDETDLSKVEMRLELFAAYTEGFLRACPDLTDVERTMLPMGAKLMTLECGIRFLTDYLDGDRYFAIHRPDHNLDRARTQFKLVADMESKWEQMQAIVAAVR